MPDVTRTPLHDLLAHAQRSRADMIATIRRIVEAESPSGDKAAVDRLGQMLADDFAALGGHPKFHPAEQFGNHLEVRFEGGPGTPILLLGHMDTVWDVGTARTMPFRHDQGRLWGPGVYDMKTGIAQMMFAVRALRELRGSLLRPVTVLLVTDEEVGSDSSRPTTERVAREHSAVLVCEPSAGLHGAFKTARKGVGDYRVRVTGRASHSGLDFEKGQSAIIELAHQIIAISGFTELSRGLTVNPGVIRGGTRTNVIAAEAEADVDARITRMGDAASLDQRFRSLKPVNPHCSIEVTGGINRPPLERTEKNAALFSIAQQLARELDLDLKEEAVGGGSDGNFVSALGVPTLDGVGAVGEGAHATHESVLVDELPRRTALLAGLIESI